MLMYLLVTILMIHWAVEGSASVDLMASDIALKDTLLKAPSISRIRPKTKPFIAILRSMVCGTLCRAASVGHPF